MAIEQSIWKIQDTKAERVTAKGMGKEELLEDVINSNASILSENWMLIGRQVPTAYGKFIDLLAIDGNGNLIVIELKRDKTPREIVAQVLDYASWIKSLKPADIARINKDYSTKYKIAGTLDDRFLAKFSVKLEEETLNQGHMLVIVASELDASTERIVNYLSDSKIPINVLFFKFFEDSSSQYLSRVWLIEPEETEVNTAKSSEHGEWNNEYYVNFGEGEHRKWEDALRLGFIAAGGASWYSRTLAYLSPNDRIWVNLPGVGFVGCGIVTSKMVKASEAEFVIEGVTKTLPEIETKGTYYYPERSEEDQEYLVTVRWIKAVPANKAYRETGFFGNQNSVCQPKAKSWSFTIDTLKTRWGIKE